jgi:hypothetical protein
MTRAIHGFTFTRPEYCISQFKCSFFKRLRGICFPESVYCISPYFGMFLRCKLAAVCRRFGDHISSMFRKALALLSSRSSVPLVKFYQTTRRNIPGNRDRLSDHFKNINTPKADCVQVLLSYHINFSLLGGMDAKSKVFSFVSFKILITPIYYD